MSLTTGRAMVFQALACVVFCLAAVVSAGEVVGTQEAEWRAHPLRRDRRASSFVRIGKSKISSSTATEGDELNSDEDDESFGAEKRASSFVRIGKSMPEDSRFDYETDSRPLKRASSFVRIGRMHGQSYGRTEANRKRMSSFVRIGKSVPFESELEEDEPKPEEYPQGKEVPDMKASLFARI